ncbi:MAG: cell division protein FtsQ [Gallionellales bacterium RIFOXYB12_FULL_54_9]|nr:MAG: cell division protein FtsQ [Gallionellales bacterium RIFOXYB12_FULL_54_9]
MWDNAPLLRSIASALTFFSVVAILYVAGHYMVHQPQLLPIHSVRLVGAPERVVPADVLVVMQSEVRGNFFTVDIEKIRHSLEKISWVRNAHVRREFPNSLAIQLEEHHPLARWNEVALVNLQGEVFEAQTRQVLPKFFGYQGSAAEMTRQYAAFSEQLSPLNLKVTQISLSPRHAWQMHLDNEMVVELGRESMGQRLSRFVSVYPYSLGVVQDELVQKGLGAAVVDMRYRHGFAVRMKHG